MSVCVIAVKHSVFFFFFIIVGFLKRRSVLNPAWSLWRGRKPFGTFHSGAAVTIAHDHKHWQLD